MSTLPSPSAGPGPEPAGPPAPDGTAPRDSAAPQGPAAPWGSAAPMSAAAPPGPPRNGTIAWALGFLAYIPVPFLGLVVAGITQLVVGLGQRKHGEPLRPRWNEVAGSHGKCRLGVHEYTKNDGTPGRSNEIQRFLPPDQPAVTAAPAQGSWVQGSF